jgi:4-hydroxyphenylacetate 3-monooxygenase
VKSGQQYLEALCDGRRVSIHGEWVRNVTDHPAFLGVTRTIAGMYDTALDPANNMIYTAPESGNRANRVFMIPRSRDDLEQRRQAMTCWSRRTHGFVGRGPEHVGNFMAGFASAPEVFARAGKAYGDNVSRWYRKLLDEDLYVTYTIIPPQVDRSKTAQGLEDPFIQVGVVEEKDGGIVVRGAQMLGTASAISDYLFVSCIMPLRPGDEAYANTFIIPIATPGLKLYCRPPYAVDKPSVFDYPLSMQFDESDALAVFDDVFVPWENVFVYRDVEMLRAQFFETPAHVLGNSQAQIRLMVKMQFLAGLARKIAAAMNIDAIPSVQEKLGELASLAAIVEGMVLASESQCVVDRHGVAQPNPRFLYGAIGLQAELYPRALGVVRELAGAGVIQPPSSYMELVNPETAPDIRRYIRAGGVPSEERIKLFKLAWDAIGSEFGGRHHQYEMFYAGAPYVAKGYAYRNYGYEQAVELVDAFLRSYGVDTQLED